MNNLQEKSSTYSLTESERRKVAWDNSSPTSDPFIHTDYAGREMAWDQFETQGRYGWVVQYTGELDAEGNEDPRKLRASHWHSQGIDPYTAALCTDP